MKRGKTGEVSMGFSTEEGDGYPELFLWYPHGVCGSSGGADTGPGAVGSGVVGCLKS